MLFVFCVFLFCEIKGRLDNSGKEAAFQKSNIS